MTYLGKNPVDFNDVVESQKFTVIGDLTVDTNTLFVDSANNEVGIGTTSPAGQLHISGDDVSNQVIIENTSADANNAPDLLLKRNSASPADNDEVGQIVFQGKNDNNQFPTLASMKVIYLDVTDTTEDAALAFELMTNGTRSEQMRLNDKCLLLNTTAKSSISQFTSDNSPMVQVTGDGSVLPIYSLTRDVTGDGNATGAMLFLNDNNSGASGATSKVYAAILGDIGTSDNNAGDDSGGNLRFYTKGEASSIANSMTLSGGGNLTVSGSISKGSGSFKIDHPLDSKSDTHHLVHSFVEAPQADNIYRGTVDLVNGSATVNIDTVAGMTDGTFVALNREIQCFTSNETGWTAIKGSVSENTLTITAQDNTCTDTVSWLVIGERKDQHIIDSDLTDSNGKIIVEPLKSDSIGQADFPIDENGD